MRCRVGSGRLEGRGEGVEGNYYYRLVDKGVLGSFSGELDGELGLDGVMGVGRCLDKGMS